MDYYATSLDIHIYGSIYIYIYIYIIFVLNLENKIYYSLKIISCYLIVTKALVKIDIILRYART